MRVRWMEKQSYHPKTTYKLQNYFFQFIATIVIHMYIFVILYYALLNQKLCVNLKKEVLQFLCNFLKCLLRKLELN